MGLATLTLSRASAALLQAPKPVASRKKAKMESQQEESAELQAARVVWAQIQAVITQLQELLQTVSPKNIPRAQINKQLDTIDKLLETFHTNIAKLQNQAASSNLSSGTPLSRAKSADALSPTKRALARAATIKSNLTRADTVKEQAPDDILLLIKGGRSSIAGFKALDDVALITFLPPFINGIAQEKSKEELQQQRQAEAKALYAGNLTGIELDGTNRKQNDDLLIGLVAGTLKDKNLINSFMQKYPLFAGDLVNTSDSIKNTELAKLAFSSACQERAPGIKALLLQPQMASFLTRSYGTLLLFCRYYAAGTPNELNEEIDKLCTNPNFLMYMVKTNSIKAMFDHLSQQPVDKLTLKLITTLFSKEEVLNDKITVKALLHFIKTTQSYDLVDILSKKTKNDFVGDDENYKLLQALRIEYAKKLAPFEALRIEDAAKKLTQFEAYLSSLFSPRDFFEYRQRQTDRSNATPWTLHAEIMQRFNKIVQLSIINAPDSNTRSLRMAQWLLIAQALCENHAYGFASQIAGVFNKMEILRLLTTNTDSFPKELTLALPEPVHDILRNLLKLFSSAGNFKAYADIAKQHMEKMETLYPIPMQMSGAITFGIQGNPVKGAPKLTEVILNIGMKTAHSIPQGEDPIITAIVEHANPAHHPLKRVIETVVEKDGSKKDIIVVDVTDEDKQYLRDFFRAFATDSVSSASFDYGIDDLWDTLPKVVGYSPASDVISAQELELTKAANVLDCNGLVEGYTAARSQSLVHRREIISATENPNKKERRKAQRKIDDDFYEGHAKLLPDEPTTILIDVFSELVKKAASNSSFPEPVVQDLIARKIELFEIAARIQYRNDLLYYAEAPDDKKKKLAPLLIKYTIDDKTEVKLKSFNPYVDEFVAENKNEFIKGYLQDYLSFVELHAEYQIQGESTVVSEADLLSPSQERQLAKLGLKPQWLNNLRWFLRKYPDFNNPQDFDLKNNEIVKQIRSYPFTQKNPHDSTKEEPYKFSDEQLAILAFLNHVVPDFSVGFNALFGNQEGWTVPSPERPVQAIIDLQSKQAELAALELKMQEQNNQLKLVVEGGAQPITDIFKQEYLSNQLKKIALGIKFNINIAGKLESRKAEKQTSHIETVFEKLCLSNEWTENLRWHLETNPSFRAPLEKFYSLLIAKGVAHELKEKMKKQNDDPPEEAVVKGQIFLDLLFAQIFISKADKSGTEGNITDILKRMGLSVDEIVVVGILAIADSEFKHHLQQLYANVLTVAVTTENDKATPASDDANASNAAVSTPTLVSPRSGSLPPVPTSPPLSKSPPPSSSGPISKIVGAFISPASSSKLLPKVTPQAPRGRAATSPDSTVRLAAGFDQLSADNRSAELSAQKKEEYKRAATSALESIGTVQKLSNEDIKRKNLPQHAQQQAMAQAIFATYNEQKAKTLTFSAADVELILHTRITLFNQADTTDLGQLFTELNGIRDDYLKTQAIPFRYEDKATGTQVLKEGYIFSEKLEHSVNHTLMRMVDFVEGALLIIHSSAMPDAQRAEIIANIKTVFAYYENEIHKTGDFTSVAAADFSIKQFGKFTAELAYLVKDFTQPIGIDDETLEIDERESMAEADTKGRAAFQGLRLAAGLAFMMRGNKTVATIHASQKQEDRFYINISDPLSIPVPESEETLEAALRTFVSTHGRWLSALGTVPEFMNMLRREPLPTSLRQIFLANVRREKLIVAEIPSGQTGYSFNVLFEALRTGFISSKDNRKETIRHKHAGENFGKLLDLQLDDEFFTNYEAGIGQFLGGNTNGIAEIPVVYLTLVTPNPLFKRVAGTRDHFYKEIKTDDEHELVLDKAAAENSAAVTRALRARTIGNKTYRFAYRGPNHAINKKQGFIGTQENLEPSERLLQDFTSILKQLGNSTALSIFLQNSLGLPNNPNVGPVFSEITQLLENPNAKIDTDSLNKALASYKTLIYLPLMQKPVKSSGDMSLINLYFAIQASFHLKILLKNTSNNIFSKMVVKLLAGSDITVVEDNKRMLEAVAVELLVAAVGVLLASCKSSADRFGTVLNYLCAMLQYAYEHEGNLFPSEDQGPEYQEFLSILREILQLGLAQRVVEVGNAGPAALKLGELENIGLSAEKKEDKDKAKMEKRYADIRKEGFDDEHFGKCVKENGLISQKPMPAPRKGSFVRTDSTPDASSIASANSSTWVKLIPVNILARNAFKIALTALEDNLVFIDDQFEVLQNSAEFRILRNIVKLDDLELKELLPALKDFLPIFSKFVNHQASRSSMAKQSADQVSAVIQMVEGELESSNEEQAFTNAIRYLATGFICTAHARISILVNQPGMLSHVLELSQHLYALSNISLSSENTIPAGYRTVIEKILVELRGIINASKLSSSQIQTMNEVIQSLDVMIKPKYVWTPVAALAIAAHLIQVTEALINAPTLKEKTLVDIVPVDATVHQLDIAIDTQYKEDIQFALTAKDIAREYAEKPALTPADVQALGLRSLQYKNAQEDIPEASTSHVTAHIIDTVHAFQQSCKDIMATTSKGEVFAVLGQQLEQETSPLAEQKDRVDQLLDKVAPGTEVHVLTQSTIRKRMEAFATLSDRQAFFLKPPSSLYEIFFFLDEGIINKSLKHGVEPDGSLEFPHIPHDETWDNLTKFTVEGLDNGQSCPISIDISHCTSVGDALILMTEEYYQNKPEPTQKSQLQIINNIMMAAMYGLTTSVEADKNSNVSHGGGVAVMVTKYCDSFCQLLVHGLTLYQINQRVAKLNPKWAIDMGRFENLFKDPNVKISSLSAKVTKDELLSLLKDEYKTVLAHVKPSAQYVLPKRLMQYTLEAVHTSLPSEPVHQVPQPMTR